MKRLVLCLVSIVICIVAANSVAAASNRLSYDEVVKQLREENIKRYAPMVPVLIEEIESEDEYIRIWAAILLGKSCDVRAVATLAKHLTNDESAEVRYQCAISLGIIRSQDAIPALTEALKDPVGRVALESAVALSLLGEKEHCLPVLGDALNDSNRDVRMKALKGLRHIGNLEAISFIEKALDDIDPYVRVDAAIFLTELSENALAFPILEASVNSSDKYIRLAALRGLKNIGNNEAISLIKKALSSSDREVQKRAIYILQDLGVNISIENLNLAPSAAYNVDAAVAYAEEWWDRPYNPAYHDYGAYDCANFVSQCLIAGGLSLDAGPGVDAWGCIPACDNLHINLVNSQGAQHERKNRGELEPTWFAKGDPAMFGDGSDYWRHAVFAVVKEGGYAKCNAHSSDVQHITIAQFFDANPSFSVCNYYHIPGGTPQDHTLVHPSDGPYSSRAYWLQNNKLYWVTTQDIIDQMSSLPGWSHVNPHPQSELSGFEGWPDGVARFIDPSNPDSDGILIQYSPEAVFITENGKRRGFTHPEALTFYGGFLDYGFDDVIEVTKPVRDMFPEGDSICYPGQGAPNPQLFKDCYFRVVSYEGKSKYDLFGMAHTLADPWGDGLTQHFRQDSNELAMMKPDSKNVAYAIYGGIWAKYKSLGNPPSFLGYPFSDEREADPSGADGFNTQGRVQDFEHGILVYHRTGSRAGQTFEMHGEIYPVYIQNGASGGWLGFPISDVYNDPTTGYPRSNFEGGCITTLDGINYYAYGKLNADFSGTPREGEKPLTVNFTDLSSGKSTKWQWDFGDEGTSTQKNPSHTYQNAGYYTVTLTVSNPYDSDTETKTNYIHVTESCVSPVANFTGTPRDGCASLTVNFTDQSTGNPTSWSWSFGDGGTSTQQNPSHTYTNPGTYTVSLTASNQCGSDTETKTNYITVLPEPIADFAGTPTTGDAPLTVQFNDNSTGNPTSWSWSFGDGGTSTQRNPSHTYTDPGKYTVSLTVTNACGSDTKTETDYIEATEPGQSPVANFEGNPTQGCAPLTVQFTDKSINNPTSWSWTFGDGETSTEKNPQHTYTNPGKYTVSLTATNQFGSDTEEKIDYITVLPKPTADFVAEPTSGFAPLTVQFTEQSTDNPTSWQWDFGDEGSSVEQNPSHTYTSPGTYTVSLTATNDCGSDTETKTDYIEVRPPDEPDISVEPTSLDFEKVVVEDSEYEILTISNEGNADLEVKNITADKPDFSVSETSFTIPPNDSHEIIVTFTPQAEGEITGNLAIESNDPDEGTLPVPVAGVGVPYVNRALSLNGVNGNYVGIDDDSSLNFGASTDFSIVIWVKGDTMSAPKGMVIKGDPYSIGYPGYHLDFRADQSPQFIRLILQDNLGRIRHLETTFDLDDGSWHLVAITCDRDGYAKSYIDGVYQTQNDISGIGNIDNTNVFNIGAYHTGGQSCWDGLIDEVRIWEVALTQQQIQSTMHLRLTGNEPGLVGYWRLDEEPGTPTAHDSSPYGNDGTLFGDAAFVEPGAPIARPTVEPNILVYPTELDFGDVIVGRFDEQTLTVVNTGEQDLHVTDIFSDSGDVTVTPTSFSLAMGQSQQVFVRYSPQTEGPLYATLQIESNDPDEGVVEVVVIGQGVPYVNRALMVDGDGDYVDCGNDESLNITDAITIETWIKWNGVGNKFQHFVAKFKDANRNGYLLQLISGTPSFYLWNSGGSNNVDADSAISGNAWHHVVGTFDGTNMELFVDGVSQGTNSGDIGDNSSNSLNIGRMSDGWNEFNGIIDEARIWNIARTQEEIRADMNQPIENPELLPNLVGYWNFDDGTASDSSLYGNHGTLMGDAQIIPLVGTWPRPLRGDVSGDGTISAYDAALILQYTVGLRDSFPADMLASPDGISPRDYILSLPELTANAGARVQTPISVNDATGLMAGGITLKYDPTVLKAVNVTSQTLFLNGAYNKANIDRRGEVRFAFATTQPMLALERSEGKGNGNLFTVEFQVLPNTTGEISPLILDNVELSNSLSITKLDGSVTVLPSKSALLQNYPNPFNPETWIPYELAKEAEVVIKIYNVKGELVRALSIGHQPAGCYLSKEKAVFWNGKNQSGEDVANGLYFYTLKAGEFQATRKMILVK